MNRLFKYCKLLTALLLCASCTEDMGVLNTDGERLLSVSSVMIMGETHHHVFVSWSMPTKVTNVEQNIDLYCQVNDGERIYGRKVPVEDYVKKVYNHFIVDFDFNVGDEVSLVVEVPSEGVRVHSRQSAPEAIQISRVDTLLLETSEKYHDYQADIFFNAGEAKAFLMALPMQGIVGAKDGKDGCVVYTEKIDTLCWFDRNSDLFATPDLGLPLEIMNTLGLPEQINEEMSYVFTNSAFVGREKSLSYTFSDRQFSRFNSGLHYDELYIEPNAVFRLGTVTSETYHYFNSLDRLLYWTNGNGGMFGEPIILPENVENGTGYFGLVSVDSVQIRIPDLFLRSDVTF